MSNTSNPIDDATTETVERPRAPNDFWKPVSPEILLGKLDRIDEGSLGEVGVFLEPVIVRAADFKPLQAPKQVKVGLSLKTLEGLFHGVDQGSYFRINFTGFSPQSAGRMKEFTVQKLDASKAQALIDTLRGNVDPLPF